jgi:hypothetical protein
MKQKKDLANKRPTSHGGTLKHKGGYSMSEWFDFFINIPSEFFLLIAVVAVVILLAILNRLSKNRDRKPKSKTLRLRTVTDAYLATGQLSMGIGYNCIIAKCPTSELHIWQQIDGLFMMELKTHSNKLPKKVDRHEAANLLFKYKDCPPFFDNQIYVNTGGEQQQKKFMSSVSVTLVIPGEYREVINKAAQMKGKELEKYIIDTVIEHSEAVAKTKA